MAIPTQTEFMEMLKSGNEGNSAPSMRRGVVTGFFPNGEPKIKFAGEDVPRDKIFTRLSPSVAVGDRVFLYPAFGSWIFWKDYTTSYEV